MRGISPATPKKVVKKGGKIMEEKYMSKIWAA